MTVIVRDLRPDVRADAEGFSDTRRLALPYMLSTPESSGRKTTSPSMSTSTEGIVSSTVVAVPLCESASSPTL